MPPMLALRGTVDVCLYAGGYTDNTLRGQVVAGLGLVGIKHANNTVVGIAGYDFGGLIDSESATRRASMTKLCDGLTAPAPSTDKLVTTEEDKTKLSDSLLHMKAVHYKFQGTEYEPSKDKLSKWVAVPKPEKDVRRDESGNIYASESEIAACRTSLVQLQQHPPAKDHQASAKLVSRMFVSFTVYPHVVKEFQLRHACTDYDSSVNKKARSMLDKYSSTSEFDNDDAKGPADKLEFISAIMILLNAIETGGAFAIDVADLPRYNGGVAPKTCQMNGKAVTLFAAPGLSSMVLSHILFYGKRNMALANMLFAWEATWREFASRVNDNWLAYDAFKFALDGTKTEWGAHVAPTTTRITQGLDRDGDKNASAMTCADFNKKGGCSKANCAYLHQCSYCKKPGHSQSACHKKQKFDKAAAEKGVQWRRSQGGERKSSPPRIEEIDTDNHRKPAGKPPERQITFRQRKDN